MKPEMGVPAGATENQIMNQQIRLRGVSVMTQSNTQFTCGKRKLPREDKWHG